MHGAQHRNRVNIPRDQAGNRAARVRRSLYVALTMTILIGQVW